MNNLKLSKCCFIAVAVALLAVFVAAPAGAGDLDRRLFGDYAYNIAATCAHAACGERLPIESTRGFTPDTLALRVPGSQKSNSYNIQSVIRFDGLGKFTLNGRVWLFVLVWARIRLIFPRTSLAWIATAPT